MEIEGKTSKYGKRKNILGFYMEQNHCWFPFKVLLLFLVSGVFVNVDIAEGNAMIPLAVLGGLLLLNIVLLGRYAFVLLKFVILSIGMLICIWSLFVCKTWNITETLFTVGFQNSVLRLAGLFATGQLFAGITTKFEILYFVKKHKMPIHVSLFMILLGNAFASFLDVFRNVLTGLKARCNLKKHPIKKMFYMIQAMTFEAVHMIVDANKSFYLHHRRIEESLGVIEESGSVEQEDSLCMDVVIRNVKYPGQETCVLKEAAITADCGEVFLLTGPNGSGKTTLINILSELIPEIIKADYEISWNKDPVNRERIGFVFQGVGNYMFFDTPENLLAHIPYEIANDWLQKFGLKYEDLFTRSVVDFSSGEQQRLALIAELLDKKKRLLFLDEPTSFLDSRGIESLYELICHVKKEKIICIVSHDKKCIPWADKYYKIDDRSVSKGIWTQDCRQYHISFAEHKELLLSVENEKLPEGRLMIYKKDFLCITGPNGAGKTTLAYQILQIAQRQQKTMKCALMLQKPDRQIYQVTVLDELLMGLDKNEANIEKAKQYLGAMHMLELEKEVPQFLSGGQKRILVILSLLMQQPDVLLLDEPLSSLDSFHADEIIKLLISEYNRSEMTVIIFDQTDSVFVPCSEKTVYLPGEE